MSKIAVILPAAGQSSRFKGKEKKPFTNLDGRPVWLRTAELFITRDDVCQCLVIVSADDMEMFRRRYSANLAFMDIEVVEGGSERFESVANALAKLKDDAELIAIHDAVRPCVTSEQIDAVFAKAAQTGAALLASPIHYTIKKAGKNKIVESTVSRQHLWLAQTPQVFRRDWLLAAFDKRGEIQGEITDDAQLMEAAGHEVHLVEGEATNVKITTQADLALAEAVLKSRPEKKVSGPLHPFADEDMWK